MDLRDGIVVCHIVAMLKGNNSISQRSQYVYNTSEVNDNNFNYSVEINYRSDGCGDGRVRKIQNRIQKDAGWTL